MSKSNLSRRVLLSSAGALGLAALAGPAARGQTPAGDFAVVEGAVASLAGVKRVIIANFVCAFQLDGAVRKDNATRFGNLVLGGGNAREVAAQMVWQNPDTAIMQSIADEGLAALKADLRAKGIEVLDEALLAAQPAYASILTGTGLTNHGTYTVLNITDNSGTGALNDLDHNGTVQVVGATGLPPYNLSPFEGSTCCYLNGKTYPSKTAYYAPGWEIEIGKALDCVVIKAWQFINFTQISGGVVRNGWAGGVGGSTVEFSATAQSAVRFREEKTRLSFRLPTSTNAKRVVRSMGPKDGDVIVTLARPVLVGSQYYEVASTGATAGQSLRASLGGTTHFNFAATLSDAAAYRKDVGLRMSGVLKGLVGAAFGG
ncbi:MAG: hypothetical protein CFE28_12760 [Alphaproteobacteria bacterium PA2]|nr:MAG: hypothetical protein CFE28_12760 [Alphaproteobacteria bacterium PA2]